MFGFRRSHHHGHSFFTFLLALLGIRSLLRHRGMTDEERAEIKTKGRAFRAKLREAWAVWDENDSPSPTEPEDQA